MQKAPSGSIQKPQKKMTTSKMDNQMKVKSKGDVYDEVNSGIGEEEHPQDNFKFY